MAIQNESTTYKIYKYMIEEIKIDQSKCAYYYIVNSTNASGQNDIRENYFVFLSKVITYF